MSDMDDEIRAMIASGSLADEIDLAIRTLLTNTRDALIAKEEGTKPGQSAKELTEAIKVATEWQVARWKHDDGDGAVKFGTALGKGGHGA